MVSKAERLEKEKRTKEKRERSICVKLHKKVKKIILAQLLPTIHSSIEKVHFPRQDPPKFAFIVCTDKEGVEKVTKAITQFKNDDVGVLKPKVGPRYEKPQKPRALIRKQTVLDPLTLIVNTPAGITQDMLKKLVPNFSKINEFKSAQTSTFLLQFETAEKAFDAFEDITISPAQGVTVKYFKKKVEHSQKPSTSNKPDKND